MILGRQKILECLRDCSLRAWRNGERIYEQDLVIGTNSIDVTLSDEFAQIRPAHTNGFIDPYDPTSMDVIRDRCASLIMPPGDTILGCTRERFAIGKVARGDIWHDIAPMYDGRSTCGRLFLASHITAGYGDVGFQSAWTLEIKNMGMYPLKIYAGMRIGQVSFQFVHGEAGTYSGSYMDQHDQPRAPSLGREKF